jgi:hypothetical protein
MSVLQNGKVFNTGECLCPGLDEHNRIAFCAGKISEVIQLDFHMATLLPFEIFLCLDNLSCDIDVVKFCACCEGIQGK